MHVWPVGHARVLPPGGSVKTTLWTLCGQCDTAMPIRGEMPLEKGTGISWTCSQCGANNWFDPFDSVPEELSRPEVLQRMPPEYTR